MNNGDTGPETSRRAVRRGAIHPSIFRSLLLKQAVFLSLMFALTAGAVGWAGYVIGRDVVEEEVQNRLTAVASHRQEMLHQLVDQQLSRLAVIDRVRRVSELLQQLQTEQPPADRGKTELSDLLRDAQLENDGFLRILIVDTDGKPVAGTGSVLEDESFASHPDYLRGRIERHLGELRHREGRSEAMLTGPIRGAGGQLLGVAMVTLEMSPVLTLLHDRTGLGETGEVLVATESDGQIDFLCPPRDLPERVPASSASVMLRAIQGEQGFTRGTYAGREILAAYVPVPYQPDDVRKWGLVALMDVDEARAPIYLLRRRLLVLVLALLVMGVVVAFALTQRLTRPLLRLTRLASGVAGTVPAPALQGRPDEIGDLATAFDHMTQELENTYATLEQRVAERTAELSQANERMTVEIAVRTRAEQALRNSEAEYSSLVENVPLCVIRKDLSGRFTFVNRAVCELLGKSREEIIGQTDLDMFPPELARKYRQDDERVVRSGQIFSDVEEHESGDTKRYVEVLKTPVHDPQGRVIGIQAIFWDVSDRKRAEDALRESAARKRAIFQAALDCIVIINAKGEIVEFNRAAEKTFGWRSEEVIGRDMDKLLFPPQFRKRHRDNIDRYSSTREEGSLLGKRLELIAVRKGGEEFPIEMAMQPVPLDGTPMITLFMRDITARKKAESALNHERYLLHTLLEYLPDNIYFKDQESRFFRVSRALARRFGFDDPQAVVGKSDFDFFAETHARATRRDEQEVMKSGEPIVDREELETWPDGRQTWVSTTKLPLLDGEGHVVGTFGISRDITEQKRAEEAWARLAAIVESSEDAIIGQTLDGIIASWNAGAERLYGYSAAEAVGQPVLMLVSPDRPYELPIILDKIARGERVEHFETIRLHKDGTPIDVSLTISPIKGQNGTMIGISTIARDITHRKQAEAALREAKEAAEAASRAKSDFLANMSHEIRTPLNAIIGMTELVLDTQLTGPQQEYLMMVRESGESLLSVINDILDFSKIEAGKLELDRIAFAPRETLGDTMKSLALRAHRKRLELACHFAPDVPLAVIGDAGRLRQIVVNLVGNAIKFTAAGEVVLDVSREEQHEDEVVLHFQVRDTGIGIPKEKMSSIFEAFEQADTSTTRRYGGTGLGLAIVLRLVELMGGRVWVESEVGQGSTFHFTARFGRMQSDALGLIPATPSDLRGLRVLVVDDNDTNRLILEEMLRSWDMEPVMAADVEQAIAAMHRSQENGLPVRLVLTDANMPDQDGFTLAERVKQDPRLDSSVVMMLTSGGRPGDIARCEKLGVAAYLMKPIKQWELFDAIAAAMGLELPGEEVVPSGPPLPRRMQRSLHVLLAEDSLVNQKLAVGLLEKWGHTVSVAGNGLEAVTLLEQQAFDIVLMDVQMPEMDGLETTALIRERERKTGQHVPIIAMTAHAMKGDRERCLAAGMDGYVAKPVRAGELFNAIAQFFAEPAVSSETGNSDSIAPSSDSTVPVPAVEPPLSQIRWDAALEGMQRDRSLLKDVAEGFLIEYPGLLQQIEQAVTAGDSTMLRRTAHTLKGALQTFRVQTAELAYALELKGRDGAVDEANAIWMELKPAVESVAHQLREFVEADSATEPPAEPTSETTA